MEVKENFIDGNNIYIHGEFDKTIIELLPKIENLIDIEKDKKNGKIKFYINSNGGYSYILFSLISLINKAKKENVIIETEVLNMAYSCGSLLASSGTIGYRFINKYGSHLCHFGRTHNISDTPIQNERNFEFSKQHFENLKNIYFKNCKQTAKDGYLEKLFEKIKDDCFYIFDEDCLDYGLADKVI